ncbi:MAG: cysteine desulfurase [Candidatus Vogelbacteria bacterium]|nr:cysteine desulfurase [Candidatus Vogelbacteria bacterium]
MDYAAATPVDERVFSSMKKYLSVEYGNPGSIHSMGVRAKMAVEKSRKEIATVLSCRPREIVFTSGGTEGDNLAIFGVTDAWREDHPGKNGHIIVSAIEHKAVLSLAKELERRGFEITYLPVSKDGIVNLLDLRKALNQNTVLVSIMYANNEIGTVQPIKEVAKVIRHFRNSKIQSPKSKVFPYFHTDACQAPGALNLNVTQLGVDLMTISGAKIYGPKGVGALYVKADIKITSQIYGGGQEFGLRSGTESVAYIVGLARALVLAEEERDKESQRITALRNYFIKKLEDIFPEVELNGSVATRLPNNLNVYFPGILGEQLVIELDAIGVEVSVGSACHANGTRGSHVIWAISQDSDRINGSVRFTLGRGTSKKDADFVLKNLRKIIDRLTYSLVRV